jgi:hypothetical protein
MVPPPTKFEFGLVTVFGRFRTFNVGVLVRSSAEPLFEFNPPANGLGGRLDVRTPCTPPRGGCGKALILIVFLRVLPAEFTPAPGRSLGRGEVLPLGDAGKERCGCEGARNPLLGRLGTDDVSERAKSANVGILPVLFRVFGNAGRAEVGGPKEGLDGRGIDAAI